MSSAIHAPTCVEHLWPDPMWRGRLRTGIDSIDVLPPTLRSLVDGTQTRDVALSILCIWTGEQAFGRPGWWRTFNGGPAACQLVADPTPIIALPVEEAPAEELPPAEDGPDFVTISKKLRDWLGLSYDELASITGVGRTTFFDWGRTARVPRPATTQRLLRVYALARALVGELGVTEAATWFRAGQPAPLDLLRDRDLDAVERAAAAQLFRPTERRHDYAAFAPEPDFDLGPLEPTAPARRAARAARRIKLPAR